MNRDELKERYRDNCIIQPHHRKGNQMEKTFCPYGSLMACEFLPQHKSPGGVILPDIGGGDIKASAGEVQRAKVVAIGPEVKYYKPGDIVLVRNGMFLKHKGQQFAMLPEEETFGCENRDLVPLEGQDAEDREQEKKMKEVAFEEASGVVASMIGQKKKT